MAERLSGGNAGIALLANTAATVAVLATRIALLTVFVFYLDGESIIAQSRRVLVRFFGDRLGPYIATMATMMRSVVYGLLVTAFAQ